MKESPRWSIRTCFHALLFTLLASSAVIFLVLQRSPWNEASLCVGIGTLLIFLFYLHLLYVGARFEDDGTYSFQLYNLKEYVDIPALPDDALDLSFDLGDDFISAIVGIVVFLISLVVMLSLVTLLVWLGINISLLSYMILMTPSLYAFKTSLGYLLHYGERCKGNLMKSTAYAAPPALLKGLFMAALLHYIHLLVA